MPAPSLDPLESRQLLSAAAIPAPHHHALRLHHAAVIERARSGHARGADPAATATSTSFQTAAQFNNASFAATAAIADNDIWTAGASNPNTSNTQPLAVHLNGTSWSAVSTPALSHGGVVFNDVSAAASNDVWTVGSQNVGGSFNTLIEH
jgi:hypothetical protein